ncbi:MAG: response regulator [Terriglobia bacterium]|nr:MAG: response regulator [Terriglobia bacterium]
MALKGQSAHTHRTNLFSPLNADTGRFSLPREFLRREGRVMDGTRIVILVADDEELVRDMILVMMRKDGYQVLIASDGAEALDLSRRYNGHINLLISDIQMPRMTGIELADVLIKERPTMKVLLISGSTDLTIPRIFPFLRKPFTPGALRDAIVRLLPSSLAASDAEG